MNTNSIRQASLTPHFNSLLFYLFIFILELQKEDEIVPLYAGFEPQTKAVFPLGTKKNNYTMDVMVKVMDKFFFTTSSKFKIRVRKLAWPPSLNNYIRE